MSACFTDLTVIATSSASTTEAEAHMATAARRHRVDMLEPMRTFVAATNRRSDLGRRQAYLISSKTPTNTGESRGENQQEPRASSGLSTHLIGGQRRHRQGQRETPRHAGASPSALATTSSRSSMTRRSPVRTLSRHARASRPFLIGSRAMACVSSSSRMPAASLVN